MSLQIEKLEKNMAKLTIETDASAFEKAVEKAYQRQKNRINIPGFRRGKAPRQLVEKMYGKEVFFEDAANILIPDAYDQALDECGEDVVSSPQIEVTQIAAGEPFIFTALVALKPPVKLGQYKGVSVEKIDTTVTEEDVEAEIERERENNARNVIVDDRPVQDGDMTVLDFEGFVDGAAFEGGKGEEYPLTIGSGAFIPGFEEQLVGAELGVEKEVQVTFPENYQAEHLRGKEAVFKCTVREIRAKELPELNDEFAEDVSEFETLAEYREGVKKELEEKKTREAKREQEDAAVKAVVEASEMEIPDAMLETEQKRMMDEFAQRITMQGLSMEQYYQLSGTSYGQMAEQVRPQALERIRMRLTLEAVAKEEGITATEEEYEEELKTMAQVYQMSKDRVRDLMGEREKKNIMQDLAVKKAASFIGENAAEK